jgi:hypothetical protein
MPSTPPAVCPRCGFEPSTPPADAWDCERCGTTNRAARLRPPWTGRIAAAARAAWEARLEDAAITARYGTPREQREGRARLAHWRWVQGRILAWGMAFAAFGTAALCFAIAGDHVSGRMAAPEVLVAAGVMFGVFGLIPIAAMLPPGAMRLGTAIGILALTVFLLVMNYLVFGPHSAGWRSTSHEVTTFGLSPVEGARVMLVFFETALAIRFLYAGWMLMRLRALAPGGDAGIRQLDWELAAVLLLPSAFLAIVLHALGVLGWAAWLAGGPVR